MCITADFFSNTVLILYIYLIADINFHPILFFRSNVSNVVIIRLLFICSKHLIDETHDPFAAN